MIRIVRVASVAGALLATVACIGGGDRPIVIDGWADTARWDSGDPDETGDTSEDTEEPLGATGGLSFAYTFDPGMLGTTSCADAGLDVISVILIPAEGDPREPIVFPCAGQALRVYGLPVGAYVAGLVGGEAPDITWESAPATVNVSEEAVQDVPAVLVCHPNEMDDGCGGA